MADLVQDQRAAGIGELQRGESAADPEPEDGGEPAT